MTTTLTPWFARNIELLGYHDLGGKPAFKLALQEVNGRWYLYMGHLWHRGWSILDVTDPSAPQYAAFIPGPENSWTIQIQVAEGKMVTALERIAPGWGGIDAQPFTEGFLVWDLAEPKKPKQLGHYRTESTGTHRNFYDGGPLVHAAGGAPGVDGKIYQIVDISEPTKPREVSRFSLPEQAQGAPKSGARLSLHGPAHVEGSRAYLPYFNAGLRVYDIRDPRTPKEIACFIPPDPQERIGTKPSRLVAQVEDVLVDRRGCIYISEKNQGIYVLRLKEIWPYSAA